MQIDRERLAHTVYDADDPISGDPIGALIDSDKPDDVCAIVVSTILADIAAQGFVVVPREKLARIRSSMTLLLNNSQGCALNHYGDDAATLGLPGWLEDCRKDVLDFTAMIDAGEGEG